MKRRKGRILKGRVSRREAERRNKDGKREKLFLLLRI